MDTSKNFVYSLQERLMSEKSTKSSEDYETSVWRLTEKWIDRMRSELDELTFTRLLPTMYAMGLLMLHYPDKLVEYYETGRVNI